MRYSEVGAEFEDDLPDVVEPLGQAVDGLGKQLFPARAFFDEGSFGVTRQLEQEGSDFGLFGFEVQSGYASVPALHLCGRGGGPLLFVLGDGIQEGREVLLDEEMLGVGWETIINLEEPVCQQLDNRTVGVCEYRTFCLLH